MAAETGFTIDGRIYEEVVLGDLDTDERFILYDYSKITEEDFLQLDGETDEQHEDRVLGIVKHPGYWPALWHCAYRRAHPDKDFAAIRAVIGKCKFTQVMDSLGVEIEEYDVPLELTSEPTSPSASSSLENDNSTEPSTPTPGDGSTNGSDGAADGLPITGALRSATSSISGQEISAA